ncbi:MAG TPA: right-handed parallel beta-helix repeat-containing protein [Geminicoccaceae bacterium]|nr:right-handed parallel beta-helix repeat-containing protein [Geminicoccaceae bacterium]
MLVPEQTIEAIRRALLLKPAIGIGIVSLCAWSGPAHAVSCGDVLGPGGVVVLSQDLSCDTLPVLTVEGPVTFNLRGFRVVCDPAGGTGIDVIGSQARIRNGTIENCAIGMMVEGEGGHRLTRLTVRSPDVPGNGGIGFQVKSGRNRFVRNLVEKFAGEGFRLGDDGVTADQNRLVFNKVIDSENHGFRVRIGQRNLFIRNIAKRNTGEGFRSQDRDNQFFSNKAYDNADEGFRIRDEAAQNNLVISNRVKGNGLDPCNLAAGDANPGIAVVSEAAGNEVRRNKVLGNCIGIAVDAGALRNAIILNTVLGSSLVDMADGNVDCDENEWRGNEFETSIALPSPECIR